MDSQFEDAARHAGEDAEGRASQDTHITTTDGKQREMNAALAGFLAFSFSFIRDPSPWDGNPHIQVR